MRRLPIFFLLDVSESMLGENLYQIEEGLARVFAALRTDPHALDTAWISIIAFAGQVRTVMPLTELMSVTPPSLPVGGGTSLGRALDFLMREIDTKVRRNTPETKGDWKPIVFLITDGKPTDDVSGAGRRWRERYDEHVTLVAVSIGRSADLTVLNQLTDADKVLTLIDESETGFRRFVDWVTQSVQTRSRSVGDPAAEELLPAADDSILKKLNLDKPLDRIDESSAYFVSRCQKTELPYVSRYEPSTVKMNVSGRLIEAAVFRLAGCYPVNNTYFDMSSDQPNVATVESSQLIGMPGCPHCGNPVGFAMCGCGNTFCIEGEGEQTCPWCRVTGVFAQAPAGTGSVDITRSRG